MGSRAFDLAVAELIQSIGLIVRRARTAGNPQDLSWTESAVLKHLARQGPATTAELARAHGMRPQSMRTILTQLEKLRMIARKPHATDLRQVNIKLTAKGTAAQKEVGDAKRTWISQAIAQLDGCDQKTLFEASRIMHRLASSESSQPN